MRADCLARQSSLNNLGLQLHFHCEAQVAGWSAGQVVACTCRESPFVGPWLRRYLLAHPIGDSDDERQDFGSHTGSMAPICPEEISWIASDTSTLSFGEHDNL